MKRMLSDFALTNTCKTLLTALATQTGGQAALLDKQGNPVSTFGDLPFLCKIIHNRDKRLCQENSKLNEENPHYACEGGLATFSAPLFLNGESIGSIVLRGVRLTEQTPSFSILSEQINVDVSELEAEFAKVTVTNERVTLIIDAQVKYLANIIPYLCTEEVKSSRKIQSLSSFQKLHGLLATTSELEGVINNILTFLTTELPFQFAALHLIDLKQAYLSSPMSFPREEIESKLAASLGSYSQMMPDLSKDFALSKIEGIETAEYSLLAFPIGSEVRHALFFCYGEPGLTLNEVELDLLEVLKLRFKDIIIKHLQLESAHRSAITDKLTHLFNRRYFNDRMGLELAECRETKSPISLIMCDLDHFKKLNDAFGHQKGDEILSLFGKIIMTTVRRSDIACRYGGEEFAVILPKTPLSDAKMVATRIREAVDGHDFGYIEQTNPVTVSVGLATCSNGSIDANQLLKEADAALYRAKNLGRNRVECSLVVDKNLGVIDVNAADDLYVQKSGS